MADANSTSFIPKNANSVRKPRKSKRIYIFSYISYVFFFGTLLMTLGVYVYGIQVANALEDAKQQIASERAAFSEGDIAAVRDLEKRFILAEQLVAESSAPSSLFESLESVIADPVRIVDFTYERLANNDFTLTFAAAANVFDPLIFQRELIRSVPALASADISEYTYGTGGEEGDEFATTGSGEQVVVVFESSASASFIPYEPMATENNVTLEETDGTATTSTDATGATSTDATEPETATSTGSEANIE